MAKRNSLPWNKTFDHSQLVGIYQGPFSEKYEKVRELGSGADGTTYLVKARSCGYHYVAKEAHNITHQGQLDFEAEFKKMKALHHANILKVYEMVKGQEYIDGELQDQIFVVTDLAKGGDLHSYLRKVIEHGALTEEWVAGVFKKALSGVVHLHHTGKMIHNDIKPENILVMDPFDPESPSTVPLVVLTDFGRAQFHKDTNFVHGDPRYQSPETWTVLTALWNDQPHDDLDVRTGEKADVWSLGATLFELLSGGFLPFLYRQCDLDTFMTNDDMSNRLQKALASDLPVLLVPYCRKSSEPAKDLLSKLLQKDHKKRPTALEALEHTWFSIHDTPVDSEVARSLKYNATKGRAHAILLNALSMKLQSDHYKKMEPVFASIDSNKSGQVNFSEFKSAIDRGVACIKGASSEEAMKKMFRMADVDKNGKLNFTEFVAVTFDWDSLSHKELDLHLMKLFSDLDKDGNGHIDLKELGNIFQGTVDRSIMREIFAVVDANSDGTISKSELQTFLLEPATPADLERTKQDELRSKLGCFGCLAGVVSRICGGKQHLKVQ